jgi:uncharacterized protein (TIGR02596 family)
MNRNSFISICRHNFRRAFSLMELLVVVAIMGVMSVLTVPSITSTLRATRITSTGQLLLDELKFARQTAVSRNVPVEVRFYKLPDYNQAASSTPTVYRAMQCFLIQNGVATALTPPKFLPNPVIFSTVATDSPFFTSTDHAELAAASGTSLPGYPNTSWRYRCFQFAPHGSADLLSSENFFTVVLENDKSLSQGANFFTVQVNPISGAVQWYRP